MRSQTPETAQDAAALLQACAADGIGVRIAGAGTKPWGSPGGECGLELRTAALDAIVEHNVGDFTAVVQPGVSLRELDDAVRRQRPDARARPAASATATARRSAARVATGDSGPLRHRYGAARDLVLGITVALSDGSLARAGGKVIKNVAGYDLAKLYSGSFGTLGLITELAVRLHPRPPAQRDRDRRRPTTRRSLQRAAIALPRARWRRSRSTCAGRRRAAPCSPASPASPPSPRPPPPSASSRSSASTPPRPRTTTSCGRASAPRSAAPRAARSCACRAARPALADACVAAQIAGATLVGRAALGLWWIGLPATAPGELVTAIARLRKVLAPSPCVVLDAPAHVRAHLDPWDHVEDPAVVLMRRVKERFDPTRTCNPGIFVGGI